MTVTMTVTKNKVQCPSFKHFAQTDSLSIFCFFGLSNLSWRIRVFEHTLEVNFCLMWVFPIREMRGPFLYEILMDDAYY